MANELKLLGKRVAELRSKRELTQEKLAELVGYSTNHIAKLEAARTNPSFDLIVKIATSLNVEIKELFCYEEQNSPEYVKKELQKIIKSTDDETIKILYKLYKSLVN